MRFLPVCGLSWVLFITTITLNVSPSFAQIGVEPDWSTSAKIAPGGRPNPYEWDETTLKEKVKRGRDYALHYPVTVTGLLLPAKPTLKILNAKPGDALFTLMKTVLSFKKDFKNFKGFWEWMGLVSYPSEEKELYPMGVSFIERHGVQGVTFGCAACHTGELFGKQIVGLTNRFPRANQFFIEGKKALRGISPEIFAVTLGATSGEKAMYRESREKILSVETTSPVTLGLDTSLAQVALSLARRAPGIDAERTANNAKHPRPTLLDHLVADSKPSVWWNVKYKNRWLSDGSVVSGNPVFTNFLWNEIGRGVDLPELMQWLSSNYDKVQDLTAAVFASEAPKFKDFFGESFIHVDRAKRGEALFAKSCAECHGNYDKAWSLNAEQFAQLKSKKPDLALIDTLMVRYPETTPVVNVGTDPNRSQGMQALADGLNPLRFSQQYKILIETQKGYVPPPLEGIWARYPYLHNNSIPNLCALMTDPAHRPMTYVSGKAINKDSDYDQTCMGYPLGDRAPAAWKKDPDHLYDTRKAGLSNLGHFEKIFTANGVDKFNGEQKKDLIEYLKTL